MTYCLTMENENVTYKEIENFPAYRVGTDGTVWSRYVKGGAGGGLRLGEKWKLLKAPVNPHDGYPEVLLYNNGIPNCKRVHALILQTFVGPCPDGMECCHGNGIRNDNRLCNLRWDTSLANSADKINHGTHPVGELNSQAKLTLEDVRKIRILIAEKIQITSIARQFGVSDTAIHLIKTGKTWKGLGHD